MAQNNLTLLTIPLEPVINEILTQAAEVDLALAHNYTVVEAFDAPAGKFPSTLGDVILIDCKSAPNLIRSTYTRVYDQLI